MSILVVLLTACTPVLTSPDGGSTEPWVAPENSWPMGAPPTDLVAEGFDVGEVIPDFRMPDQYGAEVSLWQFYGHAVIVDVSTMWCGPCQQLAGGVQAIADAWRDEGLVYLSVFPQNVRREVPTQDNLVEWGEAFDIAEPLLSDAEGWSYGIVPLAGGDGGFPGIVLVDEDMRVVTRISPPTDGAIEEALDEHL